MGDVLNATTKSVIARCDVVECCDRVMVCKIKLKSNVLLLHAPKQKLERQAEENGDYWFLTQLVWTEI